MTQALENFTGPDSLRFHLLDDLSWMLRRINPEKAMGYARAAHQLAQEIDFKKGVGISLNMMGVLYNNLSDYDEALKYYEKALAIRQEIGDLRAVANTLDNIGSVYRRKGRYKKSAAHHLNALKIREEIQDMSGMASSYNNIGLTYKGQQEYEKALEYYEKALEIEKERGDSSSIAINYNNIGSIFLLQSDLEKAKEYYTASLNIRDAINDERGKISSYNNLGSVFRREGNTEDALHYYLKAVEIGTNLGDKVNTSIGYNKIGKFFRDMGSKQQSINAFKKSLDISLEIGSMEVQRANYHELAALYEDLSRNAATTPEKKADYLQQALYYQQELFSTTDSLSNKEKKRQITAMEAKYKIEKQAKENEVLRSKQAEAERKQANFRFLVYLASGVLLGTVGAIFVLVRNNRLRKKAYDILHEKNEILSEQKKKINSTNQKLTQANEEIKKKNGDITASINYAKRIQTAMFPDEKILEDTPVVEHFILLKPRDIVSGDFYWFHKTDKHLFIAAADCTGHGVPGAIVSMIGFNQLTEIANNYQTSDPAQILRYLHAGVQDILQQEKTHNQDGMDVAFCVIDLQDGTIRFSGAKRPLVVVFEVNRQVVIKTIKGSRVSIGGDLTVPEKFLTHRLPPAQKLTFYLFSDGYQDQFGGPNDKKFMTKQLKEYLHSLYEKPMEEQKKVMEKVFEDWRGNKNQIDDVLLMGFRLDTARIF